MNDERGGVCMRDKMIAAGLWNADDPRDPSVSIESAWEVVEKLSSAGWEIQLNLVLPRPGRWRCQCKLVISGGCIVDNDHAFQHVWNLGLDDTAPLAICHAALKALGDQLSPETT